jgi:protocatechuate 3,4-dioxygenase beta subunit
MPSHKAPPPPVRWPWLIGAIVVAAAIAWVLWPRSTPHTAAPAPSASAPAATPRAPQARRHIAPAARPQATIAGHVRDVTGTPIAAASVCAWVVALTGATTAESNTPRCAQTDAKGAYTITDAISSMPLAVSAAAEGFAPGAYHPNGDEHVRLGEAEQRADVDFVLRRGVRLVGSVDDATGGAVAGALVVSDDGAARAMAKSNAKGEFALWVEPGPTRVQATAAGYSPGWAAGPAPGHFFKIHLVPGSTLVGRTVLAGSEEAVADVFVEAIQVEGGRTRASTRTDEEGRFRIEGLTPGRYRIEATSEGREGYSPSSITLGMAETSSEVRIEMDPAYVVRGRVVDKETGEPCHGGRVVITDDKQSEFSQAEIEPDGWARMASVIPGTYRVEVTCQDHVDRDDYPTITVKDRDAPPLTWEVDKGARARLEVVDTKGRAVTKASVWVSPVADGGSTRNVERAEADGTFLVTGLKPGRYQFSVQAQTGGYASQEITVTLGREERVRIELPLAGIIEGVVEDEAHRPIANVRVVAIGSGYKAARSLDDGTFTLQGLPSGEYEVRLADRAPRLGTDEPDDSPSVKVTVNAPDRAKITLTVKGRNATIEGRVLDGAGHPVTDAFIDYAPAAGGSGVPRYGGGSRAPIVTDTEGHFTIEGLADGEYNVRAYRKGGGEANADNVKTGTRDLALRLGESASIAGMLTARGAPVERFTLQVHHTATGFHRMEMFFHAGGAFAVRDLPAGTYQVEADTPLGSALTEITLAEGEQKTGVTLALTLRGEIDGRVVSDDGRPIAGMMVSVEGTSHLALVTGDNRRSRTDADGRFHLEGVLAGSWTLVAVPPEPSFEPLRAPVEVPEGGSALDVGTLRVARRAEAAEP